MFFFFNDTATTEISTLSLHDALPILACREQHGRRGEQWGGERARHGWSDAVRSRTAAAALLAAATSSTRSEEHTSELQSRSDLVCRLLLEKKKLLLLALFVIRLLRLA